VVRPIGREKTTSALPFSSMRGTKNAVAAMLNSTPAEPARFCTIMS
jgi:hypothetical protein